MVASARRIGIARALILRPTFVVADEPVSALDVSVQAQVLNLLKELQEDLNLTLLFVAHNLAVVEHISDRVAVMYLGQISRLTDRETLYRQPLHPYTEALLAAIPVPDPDRPRTRHLIEGEIPSPLNPPTGCRSTHDVPSRSKGFATSKSPCCGRAIRGEAISPRATCAPANTATSTGPRLRAPVFDNHRSRRTGDHPAHVDHPRRVAPFVVVPGDHLHHTPGENHGRSASTIEECGSPMMSRETSASSLTRRTPFIAPSAASASAWLTSSTVTSV